MDVRTRDIVRLRAENRCEYCLLPQEYSRLVHHIEHIVAKQHGGDDDPGNLALACTAAIATKAQISRALTRFPGRLSSFSIPRRHQWEEHFVFRVVRIEGITPTG